MPGWEELEWVGDARVRLGDTEYDLLDGDDGSMSRLRVLKTRSMIERYRAVIDEFHGSNVVELGIYRGGSTALFAQLLDPRRLVAIELDTARVGILDEFVTQYDLDDVVRLHFGVDQSDGSAVAAIVEADLGGEPIDLVLDDASHLYGPTISSFETLFPRLRTGGLYVIEDWRSHQDYLELFRRVAPDRTSPATVHLESSLAITLNEDDDLGHLFSEWCARTIRNPEAPGHAEVSDWYDAVRADPTGPIHDALIAHVEPVLATPDAVRAVTPTLTTLATELLIAVANGNTGFGEITVNPIWIAVRRGPGHLDPGSFRLGTVAADHLGTLAPHAPSPAHPPAPLS